MGQQKVTSFDPTNPQTKPVGDASSAFFQQLFANPQGFAQMMQNGNAVNAGNQMANMTANPEQDAYNALAPLLQGMARGSGVLPELQFQNGFSEQQNPFSDLGAVNRAEQTLQAALPTFDRNLQRANASLMNSAPGRFSSRLAQEGTDLHSQALNDYNLFANQALMQGQQLQSQERNNALNFMLGARGNQQSAAQNTASNQLAARGLTQQGMQNASQNQLGAMGLMGQLAGQAGNGLFNRVNQSGRFALDQQQANMNPTLQLLMSAFGFGTPQQLTPVVNPSTLQQITGVLGTLIGGAGSLGWSPFGGNRNAPNAPGSGTAAPGMKY